MRWLLLFAALLVALPNLAQDTVVDKQEAKVRELLAKGKAYKARSQCTAMLGNTPQPRYYALRADACNQIGDHAQAQKDARAALAAFPGSTYALLQLATAEQGLGEADSAIVHFKQVLRKDGSAEAHYRLALGYQGRRDMAGALVQLDSAFAMVGENVPLTARIYRARGECYALVHDTTSASKAFAQAIALTPKDPVVYNSRGWFLYAATGQHTKAMADYYRAIKINPNYSYAFNNRGWSRYKLGDKERGLKDISLAQRRKASNPYIYRNLGLIALEGGDTANACVSFRTALDNNFTALFGDEVQLLYTANCAATELKPPPATVPAPRTNAPGEPAKPPVPNRTNAP